MNTDFSARTRDLCLALEREGFVTDAESLRNALAATGSARAEGRWHRRWIDRQRKTARSATPRAISDLLRKLDPALA